MTKKQNVITDDEEDENQEEEVYQQPNKQFEYVQFIEVLDLNDVSSMIDSIDDVDERSDTQIEIAVQLILRLNRIHGTRLLENSSQEKEIHDILKYLTTFEPHPKVTHYYLKLFDTFDDKKILIERTPEICGGSTSEVEVIMKRLNSCMVEDRKLCPAAVGALYELPNLSNDQKKVISNLTMSSLDYVDEDDLPVLVRTLLKTVTRDDIDSVILAIRGVCSSVSAHICSIICTEVLVTTFSVNPIAVKGFIKALKQPRKPLSRFDILVILTLLHTHQRDRKTIFNILKHAYQHRPIQMVHLSTVLDTISDDYLSLRQSKIFSNSIFSLSVYMLHHRALFTEDGIPWAHPLCLLVFQLYKDKQAQLISALLGSMQPNETVNNNLSYNTSNCVSGDILISISSLEYADIGSPCKMLAEYSNILEDGLMRANKISARSIHSLCYSLCKCSEFKPKILPNLMMFLRKQLFSAQDQQTQIGLITASHILQSIGSQPSDVRHRFKEEFSTVLEWVLNTFQPHEFDNKTIYFVDLIHYNMQHIDLNSLEEIHDQYLLCLLNSIKLISEERNNGQILFTYENIDRHFQVKNLFKQQKEVRFSSFQALYQLIRCVVSIQLRLKGKEALLYFLKCGYEVDQTVLYSVAFSYVICSCLARFLSDVLIDSIEDEMVFHIVYTAVCLRTRMHVMHDSTTEDKKLLIKQLLSSYNLDIKLLSKFLMINSRMTGTAVGQKYARNKSLHLDAHTLLDESLLSFFTALRSFKFIEKEPDNTPSTPVLGKQKEVAHDRSFVLADCYKVHRHLQFGTSHQEVADGTIYQFMAIVEHTICLLFRKATDLMVRFNQLRTQSVGSESESDEDMGVELELDETNSRADQLHTYTATIYSVSILSYVINIAKQCEDDTVFTKLVGILAENLEASEDSTDLSNLQMVFGHLFGLFFKCQEYHLAQLLALGLYALTQKSNQQTCVGFAFKHIMCTIYPSNKALTADITNIASYLIADSAILKQLPFAIFIKDEHSKVLNSIVPGLYFPSITSSVLGSISTYLMQLTILFPMTVLKPDTFEAYLNAIVMAMNELVLVINGTIKSHAQVSDYRREHKKYRMINDYSLPKYLSLIVPIYVKSIEVSSIEPDMNNVARPFQDLQNKIASIRRIIQIVLQCIPYSGFKQALNKMTTMLLNHCLKLIDIFNRKLDLCLLFRTNPAYENIEAFRYVSLLRSLRQWTSCCKSLCKTLKLLQEKRKYTPSETKHRELIVKVFFSVTKFETELQELEDTYQLYPKSQEQLESNENDQENRDDENADMVDELFSDDEDVEMEESEQQIWRINESERQSNEEVIKKWTTNFERQFNRDEWRQDENTVLSTLWATPSDPTYLSQLLFEDDPTSSGKTTEAAEDKESYDDLFVENAGRSPESDTDEEEDDEDDGFCVRKVEYDENGKRRR